MKKNIILFAISFFAALYSFAQITITQFSSGYNLPLDIKNAGDDRMFIVEQTGRIWITDSAGVKKTTPFLNINSRISYFTNSEQGLLGLAFDPDYKNNGFFYVDYTAPLGGPSGATHISRFKVSAANPDSADTTSEKVLLNISQPYTNHNGGNLMFGPDGYLYINMGDGGNGGDPQNRAQNLDSLLGKILRIDVRDTLYKIPPDNPFVAKPGRDEIWAYGLRNPWRSSFDRWTGDLWTGDVGQVKWEEIDFQKAGDKGGTNYGWRCYEGNHPFDTTVGCAPISNYTFPVYEYSHFAGNSAIVGGYVYRGAEFSNMFGTYFLSDEYTGNYKVRMLRPNGSGGFNVDTSLGSMSRNVVVTFGEDRWGELYLADYGNGGIYKFQGQNCSPVAFISDSANLYVCDTVQPFVLRTPDGRGFHYQWYANGTPVPGNDNDSLITNGFVNYYVVVTNKNGCSATSPAVHLNYPAPLSITALDTFYCIDHAPLPLTATPSGGTFSGPGVSNNTLYPDSAGLGYHAIVYTYTRSADGCVTSLSQTVHIDACLNTPEYASFDQLKVYPNPWNNTVYLDFISKDNGIINIIILDVIGNLVKEFNVNGTKQESFHIPIQAENLTAGLYTCVIKASGGAKAVKFMIGK